MREGLAPSPGLGRAFPPSFEAPRDARSSGRGVGGAEPRGEQHRPEGEPGRGAAGGEAGLEPGLPLREVPDNSFNDADRSAGVIEARG